MVSLAKPFNPTPAGNMISGPKPGDERSRVQRASVGGLTASEESSGTANGTIHKILQE